MDPVVYAIVIGGVAVAGLVVGALLVRRFGL
jgi:hypothetical protein